MVPIDWAAILIRTFGDQSPPREISQIQFDGDHAALERLALASENVREEDWGAYCLDLQYVSLQDDLFRFVFPKFLLEWRRALLMGEREGIGRLDGAMTRPRYEGGWLLDEMANAEQREVVWDFVATTILDRIDQEQLLNHRGSQATPYVWVHAANAAGCWVPRIDHILMAMMEGLTVGRAIAWIEYVACLIYREFENPVFEPWKSDEGGGPPNLGEFRGGQGARWLPANIDALESRLQLDRLEAATRGAIQRLHDHPQRSIAIGVLEGLLDVPDRVRSRVETLAAWLRAPSEEGTLMWPDE